MSAPAWAHGSPSYTVSLTPAESLEELRKAVDLASNEATSAQRVRMSLALAWLEWKLAN